MPPHRTRAQAGTQEAQDICSIVAAINERSDRGMKLIRSFRDLIGAEITRARNRQGGNRNTHYDFEIEVDGQWRRVEHKGSATYGPVDLTESPWSAGVQFHNAGCEKYTISQIYTRLWYTTYIGSGRLKAEWQLVAEIPTYEEWFTKDAKPQGDPKTAFGKELKRKVREANGSLRDLRAEINEAFNPTDEDLSLFKEEACHELNEVLRQKEFWLTVHGDPAGDFHCHWWAQFLLGELESVTLRKGLDLWFDFCCAGGMRFSCLLRWGKGTGFSNVRMDAR